MDGLVARDAFVEHNEDGVGTGNGADDEGRLAHVDVIGQTGSITVPGLDYGNVSRKIDGNETHLLAHGNAVHASLQHGILQLVVVRNNVDVLTVIGCHFSHFQGFQITRQGCLSHINTIGAQNARQIVLIANVVLFDDAND